MQSLVGIEAHLETLSKLIEQLRGVRLQVRIEEQAAARLSLDFGADAGEALIARTPLALRLNVGCRVVLASEAPRQYHPSAGSHGK